MHNIFVKSENSVSVHFLSIWKATIPRENLPSPSQKGRNIAQLSCEIRKQTNVGNLQATIGRFSLSLWIFEKCTKIWWIFECRTYSGLQLWAYFCKAHWVNYATATRLMDNISELQAKSLPFSFDKMKTLSFRYIEPRKKLDNFWRPMLLIIHRIQSRLSGLAWAF